MSKPANVAVDSAGDADCRVRIANRAHCSATVRSASGVLYVRSSRKLASSVAGSTKSPNVLDAVPCSCGGESESSAAQHHERGEPRRRRPGDRSVRGELFEFEQHECDHPPPYDGATFDVPVWRDVTVHLDYHISSSRRCTPRRLAAAQQARASRYAAIANYCGSITTACWLPCTSANRRADGRSIRPTIRASRLPTHCAVLSASSSRCVFWDPTLEHLPSNCWPESSHGRSCARRRFPPFG